MTKETTNKKKTVVIGASSKASRYSNTAVIQLLRFGHPVIALGLRPDNIGDLRIETGFPEIKDVHTVTMYIGKKNQPPYYNYILDELVPERIIFNPGTENDELKNLAVNKGIQVVEDCTLMMISYGDY